MAEQLWRLGVQEIAAAYADRVCDPVEVAESCLDRIADLDPELRAFSWIDYDRVAEDARRLAIELIRGGSRGPLHGVPIAVKELFDVRGGPADRGSLVFAGARADGDAEVVARLRAAGAIIVGTTRSHEFGWGITTQHGRLPSTRNPWDLARIPGGSSGGSAAAVAAGLVPAALATDTGGSIRIPSSFCGVAGLKPGFGTMSVAGLVPLAPSLDTPGALARQVGDLGAVVAAMSAGSLVTGVLSDLRGVRIGTCSALLEWAPSGEQWDVYGRALSCAVDLGAELVELALPPAADFRRCFTTIQMAEAYDTHSRRLGSYPARADSYGPDVRSRLSAAAGVTLAAYLQASAERRRLTGLVDEALATVDGLLTPVATVAAPERRDPDHVATGSREAVGLDLRDAVLGFSVPQNLAGAPSVTFRAGSTSDGLPCGLQLTTARSTEAAALAVSALLESELAGDVRFPPPW